MAAAFGPIAAVFGPSTAAASNPMPLAQNKSIPQHLLFAPHALTSNQPCPSGTKWHWWPGLPIKHAHHGSNHGHQPPGQAPQTHKFAANKTSPPPHTPAAHSHQASPSQRPKRVGPGWAQPSAWAGRQCHGQCQRRAPNKHPNGAKGVPQTSTRTAPKTCPKRPPRSWRTPPRTRSEQPARRPERFMACSPRTSQNILGLFDRNANVQKRTLL